MVFFIGIKIADNVTFFCIKYSRAGMHLLKRLVGVSKSFHHHWKDIFQLHGKSEFKISFSANLLFVSIRTILRNIWRSSRAGMHLLNRLVGVRKLFYHRWKDLSQLYGKSGFKFSLSVNLFFVSAGIIPSDIWKLRGEALPAWRSVYSLTYWECVTNICLLYKNIITLKRKNQLVG